ncbi:DUF2541 domain-containing protein [Aeromonas piscicola]|uniref:DUF2541 family protein n=1 Tax=Aeromonas piscicola TaxID=600645 RepID=A0ABT7QD00_9GAMM|nr:MULTISPECIES: DUF2541 family protein [Aeromonas]MDM5131509.1 DUF2541 family protein [Aeromonas piscicola]OCA61645.1 DUF2541 domain-containing protein [Aeromonas piscicola]
MSVPSAVFSAQSHLRQGFNALLLSTLLLALPTPAMADDEFRLGNTMLLGVGDHPAIIPIIVCRPAKSIMVKAGRELTLNRVKVFYGNDRSKTLNFDKDLKEDQESGWKSLGSRLCIKRIEVYGNSEGSKAGVKVYGRK